MQCNAMQCNAMQCNAMQYNAMQCNAMQYNTIQYVTARPEQILITNYPTVRSLRENLTGDLQPVLTKNTNVMTMW